MAGVKWYAEGVFHRETVLGKEMSAKFVTPLVPGALIYNRLFAWKESFAVVQPEHAGLCVSSEFPQFLPDMVRVMPEFLYLFCTRPKTIEMVNAASAGSAAVSRNRFKEEEFLKLEMPLPPLAEQRAIVEQWHSAHAQIAAADGRVEKIAESAKQEFLKALGIKLETKGQRPKCFAIGLGNLDRWSVEYLTRKLLGIAEAQTGKYPTKTLRELCVGISGCTPSTKEPRFWNGNIQWVSPKDMKTEIVTDTIDHLTAAAIVESGVPAVPARSVLIVMRSGILQRTVPVALLAREATINQDMRAFHVKDDAVILPEFLAVHLQHRVEDLLKLVKWSTTVQSMNTDELANFPVPLPPLEVQRKLVERVTAARAEIARERAAAAALRQTIATEVESLILGTKLLKPA